MNQKSTIILLLFFLFSSLIVVPLPTESATQREEDYNDAVKEFNRKNYEEAAENFSEFIENYPHDLKSKNAKFWRSESLLHLNRQNEAFSSLVELHENHPRFRSKDVLNRLAHLGETLEKQDEILPFMNETILTRHETLQDYVIKWKIQNKSFEELKTLLTSIPEHERTKRASLFLRKQAEEQKIKDLRQSLDALRWDPPLADALKLLDSSKRQKLLNQFAKKSHEENKCEVLIKADNDLPNDIRTRKFQLKLGECKLRENRFEEARSTFRLIKDSSNNQDGIQYKLAKAELGLNNYEKSLSLLENIERSQEDGDSVRVTSLKAEIAHERGDLSKARDLFQKLIEKTSDRDFVIDARRRLSKILHKQGKFKAAWHHLNQLSTEFLVRNSGLLLVKSRTARQLGFKGPSPDSLKEAIETHSDDQVNQLKIELARLEHKTGKTESAIDRLTNLSRRELDKRERATVDYLLANYHFSTDDPDAAWEHLGEKLTIDVDLYPDEIHLLAGRIAEQTGRIEPAIEYYDQFIIRNKKHPLRSESIHRSFNLKLEHYDLTRSRHREDILDTLKKFDPPAKRRKHKLQLADELHSLKVVKPALKIYRSLMKNIEDTHRQERIGRKIISSSIEINQFDRAYSHAQKMLDLEKPSEQTIHVIARLLTLNSLRNAPKKFISLAERYQELPGEYTNETIDKSILQYRIASAYRRLDQPEEARNAYNKALKMSSNDALGHQIRYELTRLHLDQGNLESVDYIESLSMESIQALLTAEAINDTQLLAMGKNFYNRKQYNKITMIADRISTRSKPKFLLLAAKSEIERTKYSKARRRLSSIGGLDADALEAERLYLLGKIQRRTNNIGDAKQYWYRVIEKYSHWDDIQTVLKETASMLETHDQPGEAERVRNIMKIISSTGGNNFRSLER